VIDRGPYANSATLDLTDAAAQELGLTETVDVGMLALSGAALAPTDWYPPVSVSPTGSTGAAGPTGITNAGGATAPSG
jgi:rare lipoprotein A (peptidoglycan hydrolase)